MSENGQKQGQPRRNRVTIKPTSESKPKSSDGAASPESDSLNGTLRALSDRLDRLAENMAKDMDKATLRDYVELTHRPLMLIWRNFLSGLSRGVGIAVGFTFFAATIVWALQALGKLNLPIVGDYIADIVRIVQRQLQINPY